MNTRIALTNRVSDRLIDCALTFRDREPIDIEKAREQHENYCLALEELGLAVKRLRVNQDLPDAVFVEDTAVVVDEAAVMTSMGADSRRAEVTAMAEELGRYRKVSRIERPARIDGGDVLVIGRRVFVGLGSRTNQAGIEALAGFLAPHGYIVAPIRLKGALHLKSAVTALDDETLIVNRTAVPVEAFEGFRFVNTPDSEPGAANVLRIGDRIVLHAGFERTVDLLESLGYRTRPVDVSELVKAESGVTCSSIIFSV